MTQELPIGRPGDNAFPSTRWTMIQSIRNGDSRSGQALASLCQDYWSPIYAYVRKRGYPQDKAEDLTQGFFTKLLEKHYVQQADQERGRFRTFILSSFKNYMANEWDRAQALKRGGHVPILSLDFDEAEGQYIAEPSDDTTPETVFCRQWARTLLERVTERLRHEFVASGKTDRFERIKVFLTADGPSVPYRQLAQELGMTEAAVKVAVHRMRQRFAHLLREEVAETVEGDEAVADEIRFLIDALGR